jgi:hypothetical protein
LVRGQVLADEDSLLSLRRHQLTEVPGLLVHLPRVHGDPLMVQRSDVDYLVEDGEEWAHFHLRFQSCGAYGFNEQVGERLETRDLFQIAAR